MEKLTEEQLKDRIKEAKEEIVEKTLNTKEYMRRLDGGGYRSMVEQIANPNSRLTASKTYQIWAMLGD